MSNRRDALRVRSGLDAWVYGPGASTGERATALDLSRGGVGLVLAPEAEGWPGVGELVRVALIDRVGEVAMARQWSGRVVSARCGAGRSRLGVAFAWPEGRGARPRSEVDERARPAWSLASEEGDPVPAFGPDRLALAVALAGLAADLLSKTWASSFEVGPGGALSLASGVLGIAPTVNPGTLAGLAGGSSLTGPLCAVGGLALAGTAMSGGRRTPACAVGAGLLAAGALGNAFDRLALGYVRDFLTSNALPQWAFNLADVFLVAGAIALVAARRGEGEAD